eukprot:UN27646
MGFLSCKNFCFYIFVPILLGLTYHLVQLDPLTDSVNVNPDYKCHDGSNVVTAGEQMEQLKQSMNKLETENKYTIREGFLGSKKRAVRFNPHSLYWGVRFNLIPNLFTYILPEAVKNFIFYLGENDAIVFFTCTPPQVKYFGVSVYNLLRLWPFSVPGAAVNKPINHMKLNITSTDNTWNQAYAVIVSADENT